MRRALLALGLSVVVWASGGSALYINGKKAAHPILKHQGKSYVCLDDLKAAGVQVNELADGVALRFSVDRGGAQQIEAVTGKRQEWLFNGIWRLRCGAVSLARQPFSGEPGTPGWSLEVELRNGSSKEVTLAQTGVQLPTLALKNGTILKADEGVWQQICFRPMVAGAAISHKLNFYFPHGTADGDVSPAARLVVPIDVKSGLLRDTGLRYTSPAPNFRVEL